MFNENILDSVSKCVNWDKIISGYDTIFDFDVKFEIWGFCHVLLFCFAKTFISKTTSLKYVFDKVTSAKWPHTPGENLICLSTSAIYIVFYNQNFDFQAPTTFSFSLAN